MKIINVTSKIKPRVKTFVHKYIGLLGLKFSGFLSRFSYLITNSHYFRMHNNIDFELNREKFYSIISKKEDLEMDDVVFLEFGVFKGESYKWWLAHNKNHKSFFIGFDTFLGLPEHWNKANPMGKFSTNGKIPDGINDIRSYFETGLFQDTLFAFIQNKEEILRKKKLIIHLDADLYSSTIYVLIALSSYLKKSDIIIFDEFYSLRSPHTEFRAFLDFCTLTSCEYEGLASTLSQFAIKIIKLNNTFIENKSNTDAIVCNNIKVDANMRYVVKINILFN